MRNVPKNPTDRFMSHVNKGGGLADGMSTQCWIFERKSDYKNATKISFNAGNNRTVDIRVFSYESFVGKRKSGESVYAVCRNRRCVNPDHLRAGSKRDADGNVYIKNGILYKVCKRCGEEFPYDENHYYPERSPKSTVKFRSLCINCSKKSVLENRVKNWEGVVLREAKTSAAARKIKFDITKQDIREIYERQNGRCYWTGVPLCPSAICKFPSKPSIDRLDNANGYTKDNIVLCCLAINIGRNSSTKEVFENFILELKNNIDISFWRKRE